MVGSDGRINSYKQAWTFGLIGNVIHGKDGAPFSNSTLDGEVTAGRAYGQWIIDGSPDPTNPLCLRYEHGFIDAASCYTDSDTQYATGTMWVLSGSGRLINVLHSNEEGDLQFLNSSGVNSGNPSLHTGNACPAACWGPEAG